MRIKLLEPIESKLIRALIIIAFCTGFATIMAIAVPYAYFKYFDFGREYIKVDLVTYNKKVFNPCEKVITTTHYSSSVNTRVNFSYQVYKVMADGSVEPVEGYKLTVKDIPIIKTASGGRTIVSNTHVPCDFPTGVFFTEGLVSYEIHDEPKHTLYKGDLVTIEATPSAGFDSN